MNRSESIRKKTKMSRTAFCKKYNIPLRTAEAWDAGDREAPEYVMDLLERAVNEDEASHRRYSIIEMPADEWAEETNKTTFDYEYIHTSSDKYEIAMILLRDGYTDDTACIEMYTVDDDGEFFEGSDVDGVSNFIKNIESR